MLEVVPQIGGDHYSSPYQHWDMAIDVGLDPMRYAATKYLTRSRRKNGVQDLQKAVSFLKKLSVAICSGRCKAPRIINRSHPAVQFFLHVNDLDEWEKAIIIRVLESDSVAMLSSCADRILERVSELEFGT